MKYVIISPVRNEEADIEKTIYSVVSQSIKPSEWVIVNDGSTDNSRRIIQSYADQYTWIHVIDREDRGFRSSGVGVMETFYEGYDALEMEDWDFLVKLDGDLSFEKEYFEKCLEYFDANPNIGIGGGTIYNNIEKGTPQIDRKKDPVFHVRGATKIYRKQCWDAIGKLVRAVGWDTLDEIKANMLGWETRSFPDLVVVQHRNTGSADGIWKNWVKNGRANYVSAYHPFFMFFKCLKRIATKPYLVQSAGLFYGYISGYFKNVQQVDDRELKKYLRREQIKKLLMRDSIWKY